jgi:hypothetical protein
MSITTAARPSVAVRDFTEAEMRRYFVKPPSWPIPTGIIGALLFLIGLATMRDTGGTCLGIGVVVLAVAGIGYYLTAMGSKPTDEEYDAWVARKTAGLEPEARRALSLLDNSQVVGQVLRVDGVVLPTLQNLQAYGEVHTKQGKDGITRFSINSVKYFYPEEHKLGACRDVVNALNQGMHKARTEEFFYTDIVGVTTADTSIPVVIGQNSGRPLTVNVSAKTFRLIASSGDTTGTDGDVVEVTSTNAGGRRFFRKAGTAVDGTVAALRKLLNDMKGGAQKAQQELQQQQQQMQQQLQQQMLQMQQQMLEQMQRMGQQGGAAQPNPGADGGAQA